MIDFDKDRSWIESVVDKLKDSEVVIPLYCMINGENVKIENLRDIKQTTLTPTGFNLICASTYKRYMQNRFPIDRLNELDILHSFTRDFPTYNECIFIYKTSYAEEYQPLSNEINEYYNILFNYVSDIVNHNRQNKLKELFPES